MHADGRKSSDDRPPCLENSRPEGAECTLTGNAASPFHAEPRQSGEKKKIAPQRTQRAQRDGRLKTEGGRALQRQAEPRRGDRREILRCAQDDKAVWGVGSGRKGRQRRGGEEASNRARRWRASPWLPRESFTGTAGEGEGRGVWICVLDWSGGGWLGCWVRG